MKTICLDAKIEKLADAISFTDEFLENIGCPYTGIMEWEIIVEELFTNVAYYAYKEGNGRVLIAADNTEEGVRFCFIDAGIEFDPVSKEDPDVTLQASERDVGGLGIYMVKKMSDKMVYHRLGNLNVLCVTKKIVKGE